MLLERARDRRVVDEPAEPVRAEQDHVARARRRRPDVDVDLPVGAERARDDRALRVLRGLLGGERARAHPLGDQRMVVGEAREDAAAPEVGARVADVGERDHGRPTSAAVTVEPMPDARGSEVARSATRRLARRMVSARRSSSLPSCAQLRERLHRDARRQLARERPAHPVGDREQRRLREVGVLVLAPDPAGVRGGGVVDDAHAYSS